MSTPIIDQNILGEVQVKLNSKGVYCWSIKTLVTDGDSNTSVCNRLVTMDAKLKQAFPNYAQKGSSRWQGM